MSISIYLKHPRIWTTVVVIMAAFCGHAQAGEAAMKAEIERANSAWNEAFNSGDAAAVAAMYTEDARLSPGNGEVLVGREAIQGLFQSFIDGGVHNHTIEVVDVHADGNVAVQISNWGANGAEKDGEKPSFGGVLVNVMVRQADGSWKSRAHLWNAGG